MRIFGNQLYKNMEHVVGISCRVGTATSEAFEGQTLYGLWSQGLSMVCLWASRSTFAFGMKIIVF